MPAKPDQRKALVIWKRNSPKKFAGVLVIDIMMSVEQSIILVGMETLK